MKSIFLKYQAVLKFLFLFLGTYIVLGGCYLLYLSQEPSEKYYPEIITHTVAKQSAALITSFGYEAVVYKSLENPSMLLSINGKTIVSIVEGCNAISVIILFTAFIIAFSQKKKPTILYIFAGAVLIYTVNLFRIALLTIGIYHYPQYQDFLHQIAFPAIIYGMVFLLWLLWVKRISYPK